MTTFDDRFSLHLDDIHSHSTEKTEQMLLRFHSTNPQTFFYFSLFWLCRVSAGARWMFSCGMWDPVPQPGIEPGPPCIGPPEKFPQAFSYPLVFFVLPFAEGRGASAPTRISSDPLEPSLSHFYQEALHPCTSSPHPLFFIL